MEEDKTLFILETDGSITITEYAKDFYKEQGLNPKQMAEEWYQRLIKAPRYQNLKD